MEQLWWRVELVHQEDEEMQVSSSALFFWWKVLLKSTCKNFSYTGVLQFLIQVTIANNTIQITQRILVHLGAKAWFF